jgi:probable blue pigment (indigoidine) exporter
MLKEPPGLLRVIAALVGIAGVALLVLKTPGEIDQVGILAATGSVLVSSLGFVLIKRWPAPVDMLTLVSWQLVAGGVVLAAVAALVEGAPPALDPPALVGFLWIGSMGTALAYRCWFHGLSRMPAGTVSLIGLVNPVVATALGVLVAHESFGVVPAIGMGLVLGGVVAGQPSIADRIRRRQPVTQFEPGDPATAPTKRQERAATV